MWLVMYFHLIPENYWPKNVKTFERIIWIKALIQVFPFHRKIRWKCRLKLLIYSGKFLVTYSKEFLLTSCEEFLVTHFKEFLITLSKEFLVTNFMEFLVTNSGEFGTNFGEFLKNFRGISHSNLFSRNSQEIPQIKSPKFENFCWLGSRQGS